jgi:hypothetical protein
MKIFIFHFFTWIMFVSLLCIQKCVIIIFLLRQSCFISKVDIEMYNVHNMFCFLYHVPCIWLVVVRTTATRILLPKKKEQQDYTITLLPIDFDRLMTTCCSKTNMPGGFEWAEDHIIRPRGPAAANILIIYFLIKTKVSLNHCKLFDIHQTITNISKMSECTVLDIKDS